MNYEHLYAVRPIKDLRDMLISSVELYGDKAAFLAKKKNHPDYFPITYKQYKSDVDAMGTALCHLGLKGGKIALIGENRYDWSTSYLAIVNGTGIVVPLDKELPQNEIETLIDRSKADAIIYSGSVGEKIEGLIRKSTSLRYFISMDQEQDQENILSYQLLLEKGHRLLKEGNRDFLDAVIDEYAAVYIGHYRNGQGRHAFP